MKGLMVATVAAALALGGSATFAGVVITEQESVTGLPQARSLTRTMIIQGNKEKTLTDKHEVVTDLDKGVVYSIDTERKTYTELPFPPQGAMAKAMGSHKMPGVSFNKTGKTRTVAGYECDEYTGSGKFPMGDVSFLACVSTSAPGSAEFSAFQKTMMSKLKGSVLEVPNLPPGLPLVQDATTKVSALEFPNMPPEQAARLKQQMANHAPIVNKAEVTKISVQEIPPDTFQVPSGFHKLEEPAAHPGGATPATP